MAPPAAHSNIRAYVRWRDPSVYAGEEIECIITFKNIARVPGKEKEQENSQQVAPNGPARDSKIQSYAPSGTQSRRSSVAQGKAPLVRSTSATGGRGGSQNSSHRPTLSLNVVTAPSKGGLQSAPLPAKVPNSAVKGHGRSLSIISLGSDRTNESRGPSGSQAVNRSVRGHGRSASLQLIPKPLSQSSPHTGGISPRQPSPLYESTTPPGLADGQKDALPIRPARRRPGIASAGTTPHLGRQNSWQRGPPSGNFNSNFQFPIPQQPTVKSPSPQRERPRPPRSPSTMHSGQQRSYSPRPPEGWSGALSSLHPISRVMSETSATGTPRSSGEFYSMSNHSDETLASELPLRAQQNGRFASNQSHSRTTSRQGKRPGSTEPETLMMGYAQTMGYFVLDGSLVNAAPFEEVKRKGVQSGGGVVGVERSKRSTGMFGAFSWGNIGESLGGLIGGDEMSSIAQMKATIGSKSIPLLSTPQNLLFVDLKLAPGESSSYSYRFTLPRGLPPTHKGRAIKVSYHLALGIQRPEGQIVKHIEAPFRILGSYNGRGETLGHDLMSPYILLQDAARSASVASSSSLPLGFPAFSPKETTKQAKTPKQGLEDFLRYTERLLEQPNDPHDALLSPTSPSTLTPTISRTSSIADQQPVASVKEVVDLAILRANYIKGSGKQKQAEAQSANRFNITRSGQPIAVLTLLRTAYRLGETVIGTFDFTAPSLESASQPQAPTFSVLTELESAERVDPSLALRSTSSIHRVTRKVHAAMRENTLFARQLSFSLTIPTIATPTFETTGVSLTWRIRVEFTTQKQQAQGLGLDGDDTRSQVNGDQQMLEGLGSDERGATLIAKEKLMAETFEITVPLKVFGVPGIEAVGLEPEALEV